MTYLNCPRCGFSARVRHQEWRGCCCPCCRASGGEPQALFLSAQRDPRSTRLSALLRGGWAGTARWARSPWSGTPQVATGPPFTASVQ